MKHATWYRLRGAHHVKNWWEKPFYCDGCKKMHGPKVTRTKTLDGLLLCDRQYNKHLDMQKEVAP